MGDPVNKLGHYYRFMHIAHLNEGEHSNLRRESITFKLGKKYINMAAIGKRF
jgi:hypothetical protein